MVTNRRVAAGGGNDYYPTPPWATHALMGSERFYGSVWECACGDGAMSEVIKQYNSDLYCSDLCDRGYGETGNDFLLSDRRVNNIITNPPYKLAEDFLHKALELADSKVAMLLRLAFLEGSGRNKTVFSVCPPARVHVFSERITFYPPGTERKGSGTTAYAWFVWDKDHEGPAELKWITPVYKSLFSEKRSKKRKGRVSQAFRRGFMGGFTSPFRVFSPLVRGEHHSPDNSGWQAGRGDGE